MAKLLTREQKKIAVLAEMLVGGDIIEVAKKYKVDAGTARGWMKREADRAELDDVLDLDPIVVATVVEEIKTKAAGSNTITTPQLNKLGRGLDKLKDGVDSLAILETNFHDTILEMLNWANLKITEDMKISEWKTLVDGITQLHGTLFGKGSSTQINLMQQNNNNNGSSAKVEKFKGGFRA